jgi:hypothetical protein
VRIHLDLAAGHAVAAGPGHARAAKGVTSAYFLIPSQVRVFGIAG